MSIEISHEEARILAAAIRGEGGTDRAAEIAARLVEITAPLPKLPDDGRPPVVIMVHTEINGGGPDYQEDRETVPRAVWEAMTPAQRDAYGTAQATEAGEQRCGSGWYLTGPDAED